MRLHLGCGNINYPDFINVDLMPASHVHYVRGINNLKPFKNNSVDLIYACHCLEHFHI
jgi:predicted SAM-dependent methyltransferase